MTFGVWQRRPVRVQGWWAYAARMLALGLTLVLALTIAAPGVGLAADLAVHAGSHHGRSAGPVLDAPAASQAVDPGLDTQGHCGCHQAAPLDVEAIAPPAVPGHPLQAGLARARASVSPDRLPRPPRA